MPYNTRRKSLSLSELGITVPKRSRTVSHPSPPNTVVEGGDDSDRPVKKSKRAHPSLGLMSPPRTTSIRVKEEKSKPSAQLSPPPSPDFEGVNKVDIEGINDDIVVSTIRQLEKTGNRPHLVKELGSALATHLPSVERSANPSALISSHLTAYLNRSWPAISPCPLAKDLSPVHPRRLYFYLTTMPHQSIPEVAAPVPAPRRVISPSVSSASVADEEEKEDDEGEDDRHTRQRQVMSPSPEVDLSSPELDDDQHHTTTPAGAPFSARNSVPRESSTVTNLSHNRRGGSPQLEKEERDFKQTANALFEQAQQRRSSSDKDVNMDQPDPTVARHGEASSSSTSASPSQDIHITMSIEDSEESVAMKNSDDAAALFGPEHLSLPKAPHLMEFSSPILHPQDSSDARMDVMAQSPRSDHQNITSSSTSTSNSYSDHSMTIDPRDSPAPPHAFAWDDLANPEHVELDELDVMFDAY
nr:hypothetical protein CFP56_10497 [Quercus suber]